MTKHHNTYVTKLNSAVEGTDLESKSIEEIVATYLRFRCLGTRILP